MGNCWTTTITYTDNSGCTATATVTVTANPTLTGGTVCIGKTITLTGSGNPTTNPEFLEYSRSNHTSGVVV